MDIVNTPYWVGQYILVLLGYLLIAFAWPHVVFQEHLRQKSPIYRFAFCISVQTVLINDGGAGAGAAAYPEPLDHLRLFWCSPFCFLASGRCGQTRQSFSTI